VGFEISNEMADVTVANFCYHLFDRQKCIVNQRPCALQAHQFQIFSRRNADVVSEKLAQVRIRYPQVIRYILDWTVTAFPFV